MVVRQTIYGIALEPIFPGDIVVIEDGRVRRRTKEDPPNDQIKFPEGINDVTWEIQLERKAD